MDDLQIRESRNDDRSAIEALYPAAFPDEDLVPLVKTLLQNRPDVLSLIGVEGQRVIAHVVFTHCGIEGSGNRAALLAPLAVAPDRQRHGIGSKIVRAGIREMEDAGVSLVLVLGDPAYYGRFGFAREASVKPPFPLPEEWDGAWQSLTLGEKSTIPAGRLLVPKPWRERALWAP